MKEYIETLSGGMMTVVKFFPAMALFCRKTVVHPRASQFEVYIGSAELRGDESRV